MFVCDLANIVSFVSTRHKSVTGYDAPGCWRADRIGVQLSRRLYCRCPIPDPGAKIERKRTALSADYLLVLGGIAAAAVVGLLWINRDPLMAHLTDVERLRATLLEIGPWGPVAIALLYALQLVIAPIPGNAIAAIAGFLYGPWLGSAAVVAGGTLGSAIAMLISRRFGRPLVQRFADARVISFVERFGNVRSWWIWALVFLLPLGDPLVFAAGLTPAPLLRILAGIVVGRLPGQAFIAYLGSEATDSAPVVLLGMFAAFLLLSVLGYVHLERLKALIARLAPRGED